MPILARGEQLRARLTFLAMEMKSVSVARVCVPGCAFLVLCLGVAGDVTHTLDEWGLLFSTAFSSSLLALTGDLLTLLGAAPVTSALTITLAFCWWRRHEGAVVFLFLIGVGIELVLKYSLPHPGPPEEVARHLPLPSFFELPSLLVAHFSPPYSFPSGHMLRTTFLVKLVSERKPQWRTGGWVLATLMAVTRVYGNQHWLSDILGGVLLGWTLAVMASGWYRQEGERRRT